MGGNLFKVGRVPKERYFEIVSTLKPVLDKHFGDRYRIPVAYTEKADYGDVDIILDAGVVMNKPNWKKELTRDLGVTQTKSVRNVFSMLYMDFQTDVFLVATKRLDSTNNFMSYNILGNLIGRIYHKFNLRYGEDGLFYVLRGFNNHISREISVTRDMEQMLTFIGLSYERWKQGFKNLNEIFEYVISSKYFCSNSYDPAYSIVRRKIERPDFVKFLDYLEQNKIEKNFPFAKPKEIYLDEIDAFFGTDLKTEFAEHVKRQEMLEKISKKYNGNVVMGLLGLDGETLGKFMGRYKKYRGDSFEYFMLNSTKKEIEEDIVSFYNFLENAQENEYC